VSAFTSKSSGDAKIRRLAPGVASLAESPTEAVDGDNATVIGGYVGTVIRALEARGITMARILDTCGVDHIPGNDPLSRVPLSSVRRLLTAAVELTGDPYFGLYAANFLHAPNFHALGYALIASGSVREFCERLARYFRLLTATSRPRLVEQDRVARLEFVDVANPPHLSQDIIGLFLVNLIRELSDNRIGPVEVCLNRPSPPDDGIRHRRAFGCPVAFGAKHSHFTFDARTMDVPLSGGSRELAEHNERIIVDYLVKLDRNDIRTRVHALLLKQLPSGSVSKKDVARGLFMSPRTLQIKLSKSNTTFQDVVNETRHALACGYIDNSGMSITEIAYLLGFSDTSNFSRAFRRWTGQSPRAYADKSRHFNGSQRNGTRASSA
jgi:AraC-like DNA-binding protein